jgi:hypothetical protein
VENNLSPEKAPRRVQKKLSIKYGHILLNVCIEIVPWLGFTEACQGISALQPI